MKKKCILLILLCFFVSNSKAEIVYIDINFILKNSNIGKSLNNYMDKIQNENFEKYKKIENKLIEKEKSLLAQQNILDNNEFQKRLKMLSSEIQKFRSDKKTSIEKLNNLRIKKTKEILSILNPILTDYVDKNSFSIVMPKKNIIVGKKNLDITSQIINLINENNIEIKF